MRKQFRQHLLLRCTSALSEAIVFSRFTLLITASISTVLIDLSLIVALRTEQKVEVITTGFYGVCLKGRVGVEM